MWIIFNDNILYTNTSQLKNFLSYGIQTSIARTPHYLNTWTWSTQNSYVNYAVDTRLKLTYVHVPLVPLGIYPRQCGCAPSESGAPGGGPQEQTHHNHETKRSPFFCFGGIAGHREGS